MDASTFVWIGCVFGVAIFMTIVGIYYVRKERENIAKMEVIVGLVVKIKHTSTIVSRNTQLWLQLRSGEIKELDLNSSDVPDVLNLQIGQIATVTFYPVLIGQKLTKLTFKMQ